MNRARALPVLLACVSLVGLVGLVGACETETPTTASVQNDYPATPDGGDTSTQRVVYRAWFASTLFDAPVAPGVRSAEERTVPTADYVYVVLAIGWDPASGAPPAKLVPLRSKGRLDVARGDLGLIVVSPATFDGDCAAGSALSQDDADFVTQRIFPGAFAGAAFDAATCTTRPLPAGDAAADVASE